MTNVENLIATLALLARSESPLNEKIVFESLGLDVSGARVMRTKDQNCFVTYGAQRTVDKAKIDVLVQIAPARMIDVLFELPRPDVGAVGGQQFSIERLQKDSASKDGYNISFSYDGARIGVGVSRSTNEIGVISAEPIQGA